jgi:hypothetical protein
MKNYKQFINEEIDLKGNRGIPKDFIKQAEEEAGLNYGIWTDDKSKLPEIAGEMHIIQNKINNLMKTNDNGVTLSPDELNDRHFKLEQLAEKVIRDEFDELLDASILPIEFDIKLVSGGTDVYTAIKNLHDVPIQHEEPSKEEQEKVTKREQEREENEKDGNIEEENLPENPIERAKLLSKRKAPGTTLVTAIDKKKILNMITQGAGKLTKNIIKYSDIVDNGIKEIFGSKSEEILDAWNKLSDIADKMDWVFPIDEKPDAMKNKKEGEAGATEVTWESLSGEKYDLKLLLEKEATKIIIKSVGVDFPMLIHEAVKGIYIYLQSGAIKRDPETAALIKKATSSFYDESQDFRYGPVALKMLLNFLVKFPQTLKYKRMDARVFTMLATDKERALAEAREATEYKDYLQKKAEMCLSDGKFLEVMKSVFSVFDNVNVDDNIEFVINEKRFNNSLAKKEIGKLIEYIANDIEDYKKELAEWERENKEREEYDIRHQNGYYDQEEIDNSPELTTTVNNLMSSVNEPSEKKLTQKEINQMIDDELGKENPDDDKLSKLVDLLKSESSKIIYSKEINRINENKIKK